MVDTCLPIFTDNRHFSELRTTSESETGGCHRQ
jgi:hypothetical protein